MRLVVESKSDVFVNLPTGFGKSVVFRALPIVYSYVDQLVKKLLLVKLETTAEKTGFSRYDMCTAREGGGGTPLQEANRDVPLVDGVAFS